MEVNEISGNVQVGTEGIKRNLRKVTVQQAISEYIWNGFDAGATQVEIEYKTIGGTGVINELQVIDNGTGIDRNELAKKFEPFLYSNKTELPDTVRNIGRLIKGKNGVGRLTFYHFAEHAEWRTIYESRSGNREYKINISTKNLETYVASGDTKSGNTTGTTVTFINVYNLGSFREVYDYILKEFSWFIKLHEFRGYCLRVNGKNLDFNTTINSEHIETINVDKDIFNVRVVVWNSQLNKEFSKHYYTTQNGDLKFRETTSFNNKGDKFHHSVYISSNFFDNFIYEKIKDNIDFEALSTNHSKTFNELKKQLNALLADKRREFVAKRISYFVDDYEKNGIFPAVNQKSVLDSLRHDRLKSIVGGLYKIEPSLFNDLRLSQKKTFVRLLDVVQIGHGVDDLFEIIKGVIDLNLDQRKELAELLKVTTISSILKTIKIIKDRYHAIEILEQLAFNENRKANEVDHIQKFIEEHYWIFGEQYNLVTAAEPSFVEGLKRFRYILEGLGAPAKNIDIDHEDRNKEPDIFMIRQDFVEGKRKCILVELKHPKKPLGDKEFNQVKKYLKVVTDTDQFNGDDIHWEFHLVGNRLTRGNDEIPNALTTAKNYGQKHLAVVNDSKGYKVFIHLWSDIKVNIEHRLKFLQDQLELQREALVRPEEVDADELVKVARNSASQPTELKV